MASLTETENFIQIILKLLLPKAYSAYRQTQAEKFSPCFEGHRLKTTLSQN